jgi:archaellum component FlaC
MEEKEYVYLDKRVAEKIKNLDSVEHQLEVIGNILEERKKDMRIDMENLDDDMLQFKAFSAKYRQELEKVYEEQQNKAYKLWEKYNEELPRVREALKPVIDEVNKLTDIVDALNKKLTAISSWEVKELSTLLDILQHLSTKNASQIRKVVSVLAEKEM